MVVLRLGQRKTYNSTNSEKIFSNVCTVPGIAELLSVHSPRDSFITHLLESGMGLCYIQVYSLIYRILYITMLAEEVEDKRRTTHAR